jgi:predicted acylesterase/phospholipase RssA
VKALVLSGGGAHGAYEAGVATSLLERERFDVVCGVSIGAINAALIAAGRDDHALQQFWLDDFPARAAQLFPHLQRLRALLRHLSGLGTGGGWEGALRMARAAGDLPFLARLSSWHKAALPGIAEALGEVVAFDRLRMPVLIGAANVTYASATVFRAAAQALHLTRTARLIEYRELDAGNFITALLASSAMPGLLGPVELEFDGTTAYYADGSLVHASPLGIAIDNGATDVTVVFVDQELDPKTATAAQNVAQQAYNLATLWQQRLMEYELRLAQATNELVRLGGAPGKRRLSIHYVRPSVPIDVDLLAFDDAPALATLFERGRRDGKGSLTDKLLESPGRTPPRKRLWHALRHRFARST